MLTGLLGQGMREWSGRALNTNDGLLQSNLQDGFRQMRLRSQAR